MRLKKYCNAQVKLAICCFSVLCYIAVKILSECCTNDLRKAAVTELWTKSGVGNSCTRFPQFNTFPFCFRMWSSPPVVKTPFMVMYIRSAPWEVIYRNTVRHRWIKLARQLGFLVYFVIGLPDAIVTRKEKRINFLKQYLRQKVLQKEQRMWGDMIQVNFVDDYFILRTKMHAILVWHERFFLRSMHLSAPPLFYWGNTDVIIFVSNFKRYAARSMVGKTNLISGPLASGVKINSEMRTPGLKFYIPEDVLPGSTLPDFIQGASVLATPDIPSRLLSAMENSPKHWIERFTPDDILLTGVLAKQLDIKLVNCTGCRHFYFPPKPCEENLVSFHIYPVLPLQNGPYRYAEEWDKYVNRC